MLLSDWLLFYREALRQQASLALGSCYLYPVDPFSKPSMLQLCSNTLNSASDTVGWSTAVCPKKWSRQGRKCICDTLTLLIHYLGVTLFDQWSFYPHFSSKLALECSSLKIIAVLLFHWTIHHLSITTTSPRMSMEIQLFHHLPAGSTSPLPIAKLCGILSNHLPSNKSFSVVNLSKYCYSISTGWIWSKTRKKWEVTENLRRLEWIYREVIGMSKIHRQPLVLHISIQ